MADWITSAQPFETPLDAAAQGYDKIAPTWGQAFGAQRTELSPTSWLGEHAERGGEAGSSWLDRALNEYGQASAAVGPDGTPIPGAAPIEPARQTPTLSAEDANRLYAPPGTTITDKPMSEGLAQVISRQKYEQIDREGILSRFADNAGFVNRFATGTAAFLSDPLNLVTAFIPGIGEEATIGRLGYASMESAPFLARVAARGVSGFTGGAFAQAPLSALHYGLSQADDDGDYSIRQAALDIAFSGGLNAAIHGGITGPLSDLFRRGRPGIAAGGEAPREGEPPIAPDPIVEAPPQIRYQAMTTAVSQIADGRPIDVAPVFDEAGRPDIHAIAREVDPDSFARFDALNDETAKLREQAAELGEQRRLSPEAVAAQNDMDRIVGIEQPLLAREAEAWRETWRQSAPEAEVAKLDEAEGRLRDALASDTPGQAEVRQRLMANDVAMRDLAPTISAAYRQAADEAAAPRPFDAGELAQNQQQLYENGYAPGVPQPEFDAVNGEIYGSAAAKEQAEPAGGAAEQAKKPGTLVKPQSEAEAQLADLEARWNGIEGTARLAPEERAELDRTGAAMDNTNKQARGYDQAAICLGKAGV